MKHEHPRWPMVSMSFTSMDKDMIKRCKDVSGSRRQKLWEFCAEAVTEMDRLIGKGACIHWPAPRRPGGNPYSIRLPFQTAGTIKELSARFRITQTTVFLTALRLHLDQSVIPVSGL